MTISTRTILGIVAVAGGAFLYGIASDRYQLFPVGIVTQVFRSIGLAPSIHVDDGRQLRTQMFEAFKHVGSARKHGALGLGLSLARAIVEMHGGSIEVELSGGGGAVFRMWLPLRASRPSIHNT
jgi:hypothetical protein